jgi:hypothetical protein
MTEILVQSPLAIPPRTSAIPRPPWRCAGPEAYENDYEPDEYPGIMEIYEVGLDICRNINYDIAVLNIPPTKVLATMFVRPLKPEELRWLPKYNCVWAQERQNRESGYRIL